MTDDLAALRARRVAEKKAARAATVQPLTAKLRLTEDLDIELDHGAAGIVVMDPDLAIEYARTITNLAKLARTAKKGPKP
jgi:hypothetical protein